MKKFRDRSSQANASFYMTMTSMIQSLALGYFATKFNPSFLFSPSSLSAWFLAFLSYGLVVQMIVVTWHEYSIGSVCFSWPLGYADSWIPILLGFSEYFVISFATVERLPWAFANGSAMPPFFISLAVFASLGWVAFYNQYSKVMRNRADNESILELIEPYLRSTRKLMFGNIFIYVAGFVASWLCAKVWLSIVLLAIGNTTLIFHAVRSKRVFDRVFLNN